MKKLLLIIGLAVIAAMAIPKYADAAMVFEFTATLTGDQEVPTPTGSTATGFGKFMLNAAEDTLSYFIQLNGLDLDGLQTSNNADDVIGLHIHRAPVGVNGPVIFGIINPANDLDDLVINSGAGTLTGAWDGMEGASTTLTAELGNLRSSQLYANVHTVAFPPGEIRGQINPIPEPGTLLLIGSGVVGMGAAARRRGRR